MWRARPVSNGLPEESVVDVRAVNEGVAARAGLLIRRPNTHSVNGAGRNGAVARVAQGVDGRHVQQARVLRAVGRVASNAAFRLHRCMLVDERPACFRVALRADCILIGGGLQVGFVECAVRIVAVAAAHRALIDRVMERHVERRLLVAVALEAELGLFSLQQLLRSFGIVNAVAAEAADAGFGMRRAIEIRVSAGVAAEAGGVNLFGTELADVLNLCDIAAAFDVGLAGTVATLARDALAGMFQGETRVGVISELLHHVRVTSGACLLTDKVSGSFRRPGWGSRSGLLTQRQPGSCEPGQ